MSLSYVNARGEPIELGSRESHCKPARPKTEPKSFHKGWRVMGHRPGAIEEAESEATRAHEKWAESRDKAMAAGLSSYEEQPEPWNREDWLRNTKKKPVRSKPYEIPEAADVCADLAKKSGWLCVEVVEVKKGQPE